MYDARLQEILDKAEINDLISAYAQGSDNPDPELHMSVYAPDMRLDLHGVGVIEGVEGLRKAWNDGTIKKVTRCDLKAVTHAMVNRIIKVDGDEATGIVHCISVLTGDRDGEPYSQTRGLMFNDEYRRIDGAWKITYRKHQLRWVIEGKPSEVPPR
jgi:ketosteroid isomerase-like protein